MADAQLVAHLLQLETALLRQDVRADALQLDRLIADEFFEFGVSGQAWSKPALIAALRDEAPASAGEQDAQRRIEEFRVTTLAPDVALATYRAERLPTPQRAGARSLRSSIWRQRKGLWQIVFHQGTPL
jgi:glyoxylase I family protein